MPDPRPPRRRRRQLATTALGSAGVPLILVGDGLLGMPATALIDFIAGSPLGPIVVGFLLGASTVIAVVCAFQFAREGGSKWAGAGLASCAPAMAILALLVRTPGP